MLTASSNSFLVSSLWPDIAGHFFFNASGLCTASPPLFSLRTLYCGSSEEARTLRPASSASDVIFFSTLPSAVLPWLCQVTLSPFLNSLLIRGVYPLPIKKCTAPRVTGKCHFFGGSPLVAIPLQPADAFAAVGGRHGGPGARELAHPAVGRGEQHRCMTSDLGDGGDFPGGERQLGGYRQIVVAEHFLRRHRLQFDERSARRLDVTDAYRRRSWDARADAVQMRSTGRVQRGPPPTHAPPVPPPPRMVALARPRRHIEHASIGDHRPRHSARDLIPGRQAVLVRGAGRGPGEIHGQLDRSAGFAPQQGRGVVIRVPHTPQSYMVGLQRFGGPVG